MKAILLTETVETCVNATGKNRSGRTVHRQYTVKLQGGSAYNATDELAARLADLGLCTDNVPTGSTVLDLPLPPRALKDQAVLEGEPA